jgi:hypothetical protein
MIERQSRMVVWIKSKIARVIKKGKTCCLFNPIFKYPLPGDRCLDITANSPETVAIKKHEEGEKHDTRSKYPQYQR